METKPFYLTSEFYASVAAVFVSLSGILPGTGSLHAILATATIIAYALSRGLSKNGVPFYGKPGDVPTGVVNEAELEAGDIDTPVKP